VIRLSITATRVEVIDAQIHIWEENRPGRPWQVDFAHTRGVSLQVDLMNPNPAGGSPAELAARLEKQGKELTGTAAAVGITPQ